MEQHNFLAIHKSQLMSFADRERQKALVIVTQLDQMEMFVEAIAETTEWVGVEHMDFFQTKLGLTCVKLTEAAHELDSICSTLASACDALQELKKDAEGKVGHPSTIKSRPTVYYKKRGTDGA